MTEEQARLSTWEEIAEVEEPAKAAFELSAVLGATKHLGGMKATNELVELCNINEKSYVLDVGCGVGLTPVYLAKKIRCRMMAVDILPGSQEQLNLF